MPTLPFPQIPAWPPFPGELHGQPAPAPAPDGAALIARAALLRKAFGLIARWQGSHTGLRALLDAVEQQHARNVAAFGWQAAETMRAQAFAEVASQPLPAGEAIESDFLTFVDLGGSVT